MLWCTAVIPELLKFSEWSDLLYIDLYSSELQLEIHKLQAVKKKLQVELHNFEQAFVRRTGR